MAANKTKHRGAELTILGKTRGTHVSACSAGGAHRWRIETPHDGLRTLPGECRKCGESRQFFTADQEQGSWKEEHNHLPGLGQKSGMYLEGLRRD